MFIVARRNIFFVAMILLAWPHMTYAFEVCPGETFCPAALLMFPFLLLSPVFWLIVALFTVFKVYKTVKQGGVSLLITKVSPFFKAFLIALLGFSSVWLLLSLLGGFNAFPIILVVFLSLLYSYLFAPRFSDSVRTNAIVRAIVIMLVIGFTPVFILISYF